MTQAERSTFIRSQLGLPYDKFEFNCWHFLLLVQATLAKRILPGAQPALIADIKQRAKVLVSHPERQGWLEVGEPVDLAVVLMGRSINRDVHVGTYVIENGGSIFHNDEKHGVVLDSPLEIEQARRWRVSYFVPR